MSGSAKTSGSVSEGTASGCCGDCPPSITVTLIGIYDGYPDGEGGTISQEASCQLPIPCVYGGNSEATIPGGCFGPGATPSGDVIARISCPGLVLSLWEAGATDPFQLIAISCGDIIDETVGGNFACNIATIILTE